MNKPKKTKLQKAIEVMRNPAPGVTMVSHGFVSTGPAERRKHAFDRLTASERTVLINALSAYAENVDQTATDEDADLADAMSKDVP